MLRELIVYVCGILYPDTMTDCVKTPEPIVQVGPYVELANWSGVFISQYPDYIFLGLNQDPTWVKVVLVHELTHFVDYHNGQLTDDACNAEDRAYKVSNQWAIENGLSDYTRWNWREWYPQCSLDNDNGNIL